VATQLDIRKAFERVAEAAIAAAWTGTPPPLDPNNVAPTSDSQVDLYWRPTLHASADRPATLGPAPRVASKGFFKVGVFARPGTGTDQLDILAEIIKTAYDYSDDLVVGGVKVQINGRSISDLLTPAGAWPYRAVDIDWSIGI
jgi:hypothetical protein